MAVPRGCTPRRAAPTLVAVHTAEGARTARDLAAYLDRASVQASYHTLIDDQEIIRYLPDDVACWAMLSGNARSLQLCFTGFAAWSRAEWLRHEGMLRLGAKQVREWCGRYRIPVRKLTPEQVGADMPGICGHVDWTLGKREGTHTDPGPNFPWDVFVRWVGDEMPSAQEIWDYVIPDPYPGAKPKPARDLVGWAATHAAIAREKADQALTELAKLRAEVAELRKQ